MKTIFIKSLLMAGLAAAIPVQSYASSNADSDAENEVCEVYTCDDGDGSEEVICTANCTFDENGVNTIVVTDADGNEETYTFPDGESMDELISTIGGDIRIESFTDENGEESVCINSEYVIDDGGDDGIVNDYEYTCEE